MSKRSKRAAFSAESLREEVQGEIDQEAASEKILSDIRGINLNLPECVPEQICLCAIIIRFTFNTVCSFASVVLSLDVLPEKLREEVLKMLYPELSVEDAETLFRCVRKLKLSGFLDASNTVAVHHVFTPPRGHCIECDSALVSYNTPVRVLYHQRNGTSKAIKVSLKCNRCKLFYGYSKYGNPESGWKLYPEARTAVEATDVCFVERPLLKWQVSLA